mmetsp:Transcript_25854/g.53768  ORF Transcript_25854/g.53768 Transcript_25854/m.53768 type:complete len:114 (-) Transcript_25854:15-356(-)
MDSSNCASLISNPTNATANHQQGPRLDVPCKDEDNFVRKYPRVQQTPRCPPATFKRKSASTHRENMAQPSSLPVSRSRGDQTPGRIIDLPISTQDVCYDEWGRTFMKLHENNL